MNLLSGDLAIQGSYAYVAQQAWIMNETVANNITFGVNVDSERLDRVVDSCGLLEDIQALPGGLQAEIGERGVNLSGGQKQRISIARAVYSERDVYLMDDPLSAVDYSVGAHIFRHCFRGMLESKTVLFVSHQIHVSGRFLNPNLPSAGLSVRQLSSLFFLSIWSNVTTL